MDFQVVTSGNLPHTPPASQNLGTQPIWDRKRTGRKSREAGDWPALKHRIQCSDDSSKSGNAGRRQSKSASASTVLVVAQEATAKLHGQRRLRVRRDDEGDEGEGATRGGVRARGRGGVN